MRQLTLVIVTLLHIQKLLTTPFSEHGQQQQIADKGKFPHYVVFKKRSLESELHVSLYNTVTGINEWPTRLLQPVQYYYTIFQTLTVALVNQRRVFGLRE